MNTIAQEILFSSNTPLENHNDEKLALLKQHFPNCFDKHGAFLPEKMAEVLQSNGVQTQKESYSLNWLGKSYAKVLKDTPPDTLLAEDIAHNQKTENQHSENLLIKGDNLEVLKHLKNAYKNQIKMIYIDPPYNTGSDGFVYQDDRKFTPEQLAKLGGMDLGEAQRILDFTAKKSNSHSAWLTFMYPRLYIARELLREDGVIFISIDDNEQAQLKILCDEVFGEENFVAEIIWKKKNVVQNDAKFFSTDHEYLICYTKSVDNLNLNRLSRTVEQEARYQNPDNDPRGAWISVALQAKSGSSTYEVTFPNGVSWKPVKGTFPRLSKESLLKAFDENRLWFGKNGTNIPRLKKYLNEVQDGVLSNTIWFNEEVGSTQSSKEVVKKLLNSNVFDTPKPIEYIKKMMQLTCDDYSIIMDFFAGSGTTAHAVMQLNAEDNGNRQFICVQLPEKTGEKSEAFKAGYPTIFDIAKVRIEKAAAKIRAEHPDYQGNLGFKIFETVPNFCTSLPDDFTLSQPDLPNITDLALNDEQLHTLLTTWRVYDGSCLPQIIQIIDLSGYSAYYCRQHLYLLHSGFGSDGVKALIDRLDNDSDFVPERIVLFGTNIDSAMQKELAQAIKTYANKKGLNNLSVLARY